MFKKCFLKNVALSLLLLSTIFSLFACTNKANVAENKENVIKTNDSDVIILYTNDVHCAVEDKIGYASLKEYKNQMEAQNKYVLLVDAGDFIQGAPIGTLSKGEFITPIMNAVGYDFVVLGNHEFDYEIPAMVERSSELNCHIFSCNFYDLKSNKPYFDAYKIFTLGNYNVAFIGVTTPEAFTKSTPTYFQDKNGNYIFGLCEDETGEKLYKEIQKNVDEVRSKGADFVILVAHLGNEGTTTRWSSNYIISKINGVDALLDGHSHEVVPSSIVKDKDGKDVILTQTGSNLANIGKLTITKDGKISTELIDHVDKADGTNAINPKSLKEGEKMPEGFTKNGNAYDVEVDNLVQRINGKFKAFTDQVIGNTKVKLTVSDADGNRIIRKAETNLGDLAADAFKTVMGGDIGIINGGAIRSDVEPGDITYGSALKVFPFNNMACLVKVKGQAIKDALEMGASNYPEEKGGFLQVSGLTYTIDPSIPSSVKVDDKGNFASVDGKYRVCDIKVNGEDLDVNKEYSVASHNYMLIKGGDGYVMFKGSEVLKDSVLPDVDVFVDYIKANGTSEYTNLNGDGRIIIKK